jgi:hypothetical protein
VVAGAKVLYHVGSQATCAGDTSLLGFDKVGQYHIWVIHLSSHLCIVSRSLFIDDSLEFLAPIYDDLGSQITDL